MIYDAFHDSDSLVVADHPRLRQLYAVIVIGKITQSILFE